MIGLWVKGKTFCAGAVFDKVDGEWVMIDCAPYLRKVIGNCPVKDIGRLLRSKGLRYEWLQKRKVIR